jgi:release factor glutamine methyltransferase
MTIHEQIARARDRLQRAGIEPREADLDARLLARHVLGWDAAQLIAALRDPAPAGFDAAYEPAIARRERREPVAHILGTREFWGLSFEVTPDVLVPRPETELLVEMALGVLRQGEAQAWSPRPGARSPLVIDVGTGSGCIAIALAKGCPGLRIVGTDVSAAALTVARRNAVRLGVSDRVRFVRTDLVAGIPPGVDLVVSNPPYVADEDLPALAPEVCEYDPRGALSGGPGGLHVIARLLEQAVPLVRDGGWLLFEFGSVQASDVERLYSAHAHCTIIEIRRDLQGIPRATLVRVGAS